MKKVAYGKQSISPDDIDAVVRALRAEKITQGPIVDSFEEAIAAKVGANFGVACNSATSGLYLAYRALGVGPGKLVWTTTNTFVATSNAALMCGAGIDFVDIDPQTWNISAEKLSEKLNEARQKNWPIPDVVTVVHFAGLPCELEEIRNLSLEFDFKIVEDASHALGASYKHTKIGDCTFSDVVVFSFHPVKMITTGEGGMLLTNSSQIAEKSRELANHGITRDSAKFKAKEAPSWYFEQLDLGMNLRITDFQSALGLSQLKRLDDFIEKRSEIAQSYEKSLDSNKYSFQFVKSDVISSRHLFVVCDRSRVERNALIERLSENGIYSTVHYIPVVQHPYYQEMGFRLENYPNTKKYYESAFSIPIYPDLKFAEVERVSKLLNG